MPDVMAARFHIMDIIRSEATLAGFQVIGTPALEYAVTLLGQGEETDKQVYRFVDHGERQVALRFDLTVPFARFVAEHQGELVFPFKKLQMGDVWRGENPQKGRFREFMQCDLDIIGVDAAAADIEILSVFQRILTRVACGPFTMAVGDRVVLSALIRRCLPDIPPGGETAALILLDKLAKIGAPAVVEQLAAIEGATALGAETLLGLVTTRTGGGDTDLAPVRRELADDESAQAEIRRLELVLAATRGAIPETTGQLRLDLTIARGLGYYTGIVFETTLDQLPGFGSISSGGRYNNLASRFSSRELPGVGGSVGLDRLVAGLEELGRVEAAPAKPVYVAVATEDALAYAAALAGRLRAAGIATDFGLAPKLAAQFKHADRRGCPYVVTVGSSERESDTYALKSMGEGDEMRDLPAVGIVDELRRRGL